MNTVASSHRAFSLVELSIVLVILGLLTGGVLTGQSLIRAAELRSVTTDFQRYSSAIQAFRDKYFALPGDMTNATMFWGKDNTNCSGNTGTAATPGTCNGDGNGQIDAWSEMYRAWQQLANAGLVEGSYTGFLTSASAVVPPVIGGTVPKSKISSTYWQLLWFSQYSGTNSEFGYSDLADVKKNTLIFSGTNASSWVSTAVIRPEEAWNIDTKMDDGRPAFGLVRGSPAGGCTSGTTSAATYVLTTTTQICSVAFILQ